MQPLEIRHIKVRRGALDLEVACPLESLHVTEEQAVKLLQDYPNLSRHVCVNGKGDTFGDELVGTEAPHLLEHLIIELQAQANPTAKRRLKGHTSWLEELEFTRPEGIALMRVTVSFADDLQALQACKDACAIMEAL